MYATTALQKHTARVTRYFTLRCSSEQLNMLIMTIVRLSYKLVLCTTLVQYLRP